MDLSKIALGGVAELSREGREQAKIKTVEENRRKSAREE